MLEGLFPLIYVYKENLQYARDIERIIRQIQPDNIQINSPLRSCSIEPLRREELSKIKDLFIDLNAISVYKSQKKYVKPISDKDTLIRRKNIKD